MYSPTLSWTRRLDGGGWSAPRPSRSTPGKDPVPIVQEAVWAPRPVWTGAEYLTHTGIRSPNRQDRSESKSENKVIMNTSKILAQVTQNPSENTAYTIGGDKW